MCDFPRALWQRPACVTSRVHSVPPASLARGCSHVTDWILWQDHRDWDPTGDLSLVRNAKNGHGQKWHIPLLRLPQENLPCSSQHPLPPRSPRHRRQGDLGSHALKTAQPASDQSLKDCGQQNPPPLPALPIGLYVNNNSNKALFSQNTAISGFYYYSS